jgi:hypothetical protein
MKFKLDQLEGKLGELMGAVRGSRDENRVALILLRNW